VALEADYDLGFATLTSSSSWARHDNATDTDLTALYTNFYFYQNFYGQNPRSFIQGMTGSTTRCGRRSFASLPSREARLTGWRASSTRIRRPSSRSTSTIPATMPSTPTVRKTVPSDALGVNGSTCGLGEYIDSGATSVAGIPLVRDQAYIGDFETRFKDLAAFGELTWHVTSAWSVTGGTRAFKQTVNQAQQTGLLFDGPGFAANEQLSDEFRRALWKVNTAYQLDKTDLVYATWSQGFRRGGVNALPPTEPVGYTDQNGVFHDHYVLPAALNHLAPDKVDNYEVGAKGTLAGRFSYSVAVYDMEWHNVQEGVQLTPLVPPGGVEHRRCPEPRCGDGVQCQHYAAFGCAVELYVRPDEAQEHQSPVLLPKHRGARAGPGLADARYAEEQRGARGRVWSHPRRGWGTGVCGECELSERDHPRAVGDSASRTGLHYSGFARHVYANPLAGITVREQHHEQPGHQLLYRSGDLRESPPGGRCPSRVRSASRSATRSRSVRSVLQAVE